MGEVTARDLYSTSNLELSVLTQSEFNDIQRAVDAVYDSSSVSENTSATSLDITHPAINDVRIDEGKTNVGVCIKLFLDPDQVDADLTANHVIGELETVNPITDCSFLRDAGDTWAALESEILCAVVDACNLPSQTSELVEHVFEDTVGMRYAELHENPDGTDTAVFIEELVYKPEGVFGL